MLGFPILYFNGTRIMMFQLSGFYCICLTLEDVPLTLDATDAVWRHDF